MLIENILGYIIFCCLPLLVVIGTSLNVKNKKLQVDWSSTVIINKHLEYSDEIRRTDRNG